MAQIDLLPLAPKLPESRNKLIDDRLHRRLEPPHRGFGEKVFEGAAPDAVEFVTFSSEARDGLAEHLGGPWPFGCAAGGAGVDGVVVVRVVDMEFVGVDTDDGAFRRGVRLWS